MRTLTLPGNNRALTIYGVLAILSSLVAANCECGYSVTSTINNRNTTTFYTSVLETDFLHLANITYARDWQPQNYTVSATQGRGPYGKNATLDTLTPNPLRSPNDWSGDGSINPSQLGGLELLVRGSKNADPPLSSGSLIPMSELSTNRNDILYGSFRTSLRFSSELGTCGAFFMYFNDSQEIDMEVLSSQQNSSSHILNLVLQSPESARKGFDAQGTPTFLPYHLPFDPTAAFHEYRFDWSPDSVAFYADGTLLTRMSGDAAGAEAVPKHAGHVTLSHWSNGDPGWSGGPPNSDAVMTVAWFKGYFNTSSPSPLPQSCAAGDTTSVCQVPNTLGPPGINGTVFFHLSPNEPPGGSGGAGNAAPRKNAAGNHSLIEGLLSQDLIVLATVIHFILGVATVLSF